MGGMSSSKNEFKNVAIGEVPIRLSDGSFDGIEPEEGIGDMLKAVYDINNNGIVDNSAKLGNQLPAYYATASGLSTHIADDENPHTVTKTQVGLANVTNNAQVKKISSSVDNQVMRWNGETGDLPQGSNVTIDDNGSVNIPTGQSYKINGTALSKSDIGLSNVDNIQQMPLSYLDTDGDLTANSDVKVASQKATKTFVNNSFLLNKCNGLISGCSMTINSSDNTKFDIAEGVYNIKGVGNISFAGQTGITLTYLLTDLVTWIALDDEGNIIQKALIPFTNEERRQYCILGLVAHTNLTNANIIDNLPDISILDGEHLFDKMDADGSVNISGCTFGPDGANLNMTKTAGVAFKKGLNFCINPNNPHQMSLDAEDPVTLRYRLSDGTEYLDRTTIDPNNYEDPLGTLTSVNSNKWTIQRIFIFLSNATTTIDNLYVTRIQPGQAEYVSLDEARNGILTEDFTTETNLKTNGLFRGYLIIQEGTTDLNNATFVEANKFGTFKE
jgi:hypothetical protein